MLVQYFSIFSQDMQQLRDVLRQDIQQLMDNQTMVIERLVKAAGHTGLDAHVNRVNRDVAQLEMNTMHHNAI